MKQYFTTIIAIIFFAVNFTAAQEQTKKPVPQYSAINSVKKNLLAALRSENIGVVDAAMRVTAEMKFRYPSVDMSDMIAALNTVMKSHRDGAIRYKAFVTVSVCENPEWYPHISGNWTDKSEEFFRTAAVTMNNQLLSAVQ